jgi:hypothetical protein
MTRVLAGWAAWGLLRGMLAVVDVLRWLGTRGESC